MRKRERRERKGVEGRRGEGKGGRKGIPQTKSLRPWSVLLS